MSTKEAMLWAQRNNIPAVIPAVSSQSPAIKAAEEITNLFRAILREYDPEPGPLDKSVIVAIIQKHYEAETPTKAED